MMAMCCNLPFFVLLRAERQFTHARRVVILNFLVPFESTIGRCVTPNRLGRIQRI